MFDLSIADGLIFNKLLKYVFTEVNVFFRKIHLKKKAIINFLIKYLIKYVSNYASWDEPQHLHYNLVEQKIFFHAGRPALRMLNFSKISSYRGA